MVILSENEKRLSALAKTFILATKGKFFKVIFLARGTKEIRHMNARLGVKSKLKGGKASYNPADHNLMWVYDQKKKDYRSIPLEGVELVTCGPMTLNLVTEKGVQHKLGMIRKVVVATRK